MDAAPNPPDKLLALLKLKRHEQPPPGYFNGFSAKVIARIEAEQAAAEASWWHRFIRRWQVSPALTCAYGTAVAGLMVLGVVWASNWQQPVAGNHDPVSAPGLMPLASDAPGQAASPQLNVPFPTVASGTNPASPGLIASNSPFSLPQLRVEPASLQYETP